MTPRLAAVLAGAWLALAACGGLPFGMGSGASMAGTVRGPLKVGLVDVFSGNATYATVGPSLKNSVQLAIDDLNGRGGLLGSQIQLVTADDQYSPSQTVTATKQLLADKSVKFVVGPSFAGLFLNAKPLIEQARVPNCVAMMDADDVMASAPYTFRASEPEREWVPSVLSYLQKGTQLKKVGLISEEDTLGQMYDAQLSDQAPKYGLQYVGASFVPVGAADQKTQVQQLAKSGAQVVVLSDNPATAAKTLQAIQQLKSSLKPVGFGGLGGYGFVQQLGDPANGLIFAGTIQSYMSDVPDARWPAAYRDFAKRAIARFGTAPNGVEMQASPAAADCIAQWARAVQAAGDFSGPLVVKAWQGLDIPAAQSVLGVHEQFSATDHDAVPLEGVFVYQWVKNGNAWSLKQLSGPA